MAEHHERIPRRKRSERDSIVVVPSAPEDSPFVFGFCEDRNASRRRKMEGFFGVFDGHGGKSAAAWCGEHFHKVFMKNLPEEDVPVPELFDQTFAEADTYLNAAHGIFSGCTAIVAFYRHEVRDKAKVPVLYTGNVGDARAVLLREGRAIRLSYDHKGSDLVEQQRVKDAGGFIMNERVNGMLAVTRALGDAEMKDFIAGRPYTTETVLTPDDQLLILACDGLWDVCGDQQACDLVKDTPDPQQAAQLLVKYALNNGSYDNMSVLVVRFLAGSDKAKDALQPPK